MIHRLHLISHKLHTLHKKKGFFYACYIQRFIKNQFYNASTKKKMVNSSFFSGSALIAVPANFSDTTNTNIAKQD